MPLYSQDQRSPQPPGMGTVVVQPPGTMMPGMATSGIGPPGGPPAAPLPQNGYQGVQQAGPQLAQALAGLMGGMAGTQGGPGAQGGAGAGQMPLMQAQSAGQAAIPLGGGMGGSYAPWSPQAQAAQSGPPPPNPNVGQGGGMGGQMGTGVHDQRAGAHPAAPPPSAPILSFEDWQRQTYGGATDNPDAQFAYADYVRQQQATTPPPGMSPNYGQPGGPPGGPNYGPSPSPDQDPSAQHYSYVNPQNFGTPDYAALLQALQGIGGDRAAPDIGQAAIAQYSRAVQPQYLTQGQRGLMGAYQAPNQFQQGQQGLQGQLGGLGSAALGGNQYGGNIDSLIQQLTGQSQGKDSYAAGQMHQDLANAISQQRSLAAAARPGQGALAGRQAAQNIGGLQAGAASQLAQAQLAERLGAQSQLGGLVTTARGQDLQRAQQERALQLQALGQQADVLGQGRTQDLAGLAGQQSLYGQMAGQEAQYGLANQAAQNQFGLANQSALNQFALQRGQLGMQQQQLDDQRTQQALAQRLALSGLAQQGTMGYEQERSRRLAAILGQQQGGGGIPGALLGLLGALL